MPNRPSVIGYLYPWDVIDDPDVSRRLTDAGVDRVALAANYHSVRAATPQHPHHRVMEASHAALYLPVRQSVWGNARLRPVGAESWAGADSYRRARDELARADIPVTPWCVITHNSLLGAANPELSVKNAFGDSYSYALCPSHAEVREYAATLVTEVATLSESSSIIVEAAGQLGLSHQGRHEKTSGADWSVIDQRLLSICVCAACEHAYGERNVSVDALRSRIREHLGSAKADGITDVLGESAGDVLAARTAARDALLASIVEVCHANGVQRITAFANPDPWSTGPSIALDQAVPGIDQYIVPCWDEADTAAARVAAVRSIAGSPVGGYVTMLSPDFATTVRERLGRLAASGMAEVHVYHYGLASATRVATMTDAIDTCFTGSHA